MLQPPQGANRWTAEEKGKLNRDWLSVTLSLFFFCFVFLRLVFIFLLRRGKKFNVFVIQGIVLGLSWDRVEDVKAPKSKLFRYIHLMPTSICWEMHGLQVQTILRILVSPRYWLTHSDQQSSSLLPPWVFFILASPSRVTGPFLLCLKDNKEHECRAICPIPVPSTVVYPWRW